MKYDETMKREQYDLAVCGGGMTGVACAVAAARRGLKTILIERQGCLGGVATSGLVNHLLGGLTYESADCSIFWNVKGLFRELACRLIAKGWAIDPLTIDRLHNPHGWYPHLSEGIIFDNEGMKTELDQICLEAGVNLLLMTEITGVVKSCCQNLITGLDIHNKDGTRIIKAALFADTTGDADIASMSGCRTVTGREGDGLMAPASLELHVDNVDTKMLSSYIFDNGEQRFKKLIQELRSEGIWKFSYDTLIAVQLMHDDVYMINTIRQVGIDGTSADSLTSGLIEGRAENMELFSIMRRHVPGFANARIRQIAPVIGIRESRRIVGKHVLTLDELFRDSIPDDSIAVSSYGWDLPDPIKPSLQPMVENKVEKPRFTHIPYRCLLPDPIVNLIVAGRSISVERDILGPVRVMAPCMAMGQAAGVAASMLSSENPDFASLDYGALVNELNKDGCVTRVLQ